MKKMKKITTNIRRRNIYSILLLAFFLLFAGQNLAQKVVIGKLIDHQGNALPDIYLQLYSNPFFFSTISLEDGNFAFDGVTGEEDIKLPPGYHVSNNFPNPFYPTTRINITLPVRSTVRVEVYNVFGESVTNIIDRNFSAGVNYIDLTLNYLPKGLYFARILIDEKYVAIKKMMLFHGSQNTPVGEASLKHSSISQNHSIKSLLSIELDSLVATSSIIGRKTFTGLPNLTDDTLDLGNLVIERYCPGMPTVNYEGRTYNTIKIGDQCWLKENLDVGNILDKHTPQTDNGLIERYCYDDDPANCLTYGGLYQWDEVMQYSTTPGVQGICPDGWHVPTIAEYDLLVGAAGGPNSLKAIGQGTGNGAGTNTSGFSALLAGGLSQTNHYGGLNDQFRFWTSEEKNFDLAFFLVGYSYNNITQTGYNYKRTAKSVRCIKDSK